jgi:Fe-S cluster biogenesis protein NfuA
MLDKVMVDGALAGLRTGFQADGADLVAELASPERVVVRLVLTTETCEDCIVPNSILRQIINTTLRTRFPELEQVEVVDPRA